MSNSDHHSAHEGRPLFIEWSLQYARLQLDQNFAEIRQFSSQMAKNYLRFLETLSPEARWTCIQGLIFRGFMSDRYQPEHKKLWDEFIAFAMEEYTDIPLTIPRPKKPRGPRLIKLLKAAWDPHRFGGFTWEQKTEFRTQLTDRGWCLETWIVFDRSLLRYLTIVDPQGRHLQRTNTLSWLGLGASEWDEASRGDEEEVVEQVIQLQAKYAKPFLHHFSRQTKT